MSENNHICWKDWDGTFNTTEFDSITEIYVLPEQDGSTISYYGQFNVLYTGDPSGGLANQKFVGCEGSYVDYGGVRYEGDTGMYRLMNQLERNKIQDLLEDM